ncbi:MAG: iron-sulfur cluster assembly accessory protein [Candidatus Omnitrophica bacterium]|nr:iron-sulfur cluster assembly accessory protein [Candidatus Omnitrophota bacterium]
MDEKKINKTPLIQLTEAAISKIKSMQQKEGKEDSCLRVGVITGGCAGLSYDMRFQKKPYDNDVVIQFQDLTVLVNEDSVPFLKGITIDYLDTLKESGFKYINPNANNSCGCGTSFS